ncbi:hypothetical protein GCM10010409_38000 [Mycolicibacterium diernhoferi]
MVVSEPRADLAVRTVLAPSAVVTDGRSASPEPVRAVVDPPVRAVVDPPVGAVVDSAVREVSGAPEPVLRNTPWVDVSIGADGSRVSTPSGLRPPAPPDSLLEARPRGVSPPRPLGSSRALD